MFFATALLLTVCMMACRAIVFKIAELMAPIPGDRNVPLFRL